MTNTPALEADPRLFRFLYLDVERVRSLAAMLFGGVPEEAVREHGRERQAQAGLSAGVPGVIEGRLGADLLYHSSDRETRALQLDLFRMVLARLEDLDRVVDVEGEASEPEGRFFRLTGEVVIRDFAALGDSLDLARETYESLVRFQRLKTPAQPGAAVNRTTTKPDPAKAFTERVTEFAVTKQLPALVDAIRKMYGDEVRLYVRSGSKIRVSQLDREKLMEPTIAGLDPTSVGGLWTVICEADFGPGIAIDLKESLSEMEQGLEQLATTLRGLAAILRPADARRIRPIAIYREL